MRALFSIGSTEHLVHLTRTPSGYRMHAGEDAPVDVALETTGGRSTLIIDAVREPVAVAVSGDDIHVYLGGRSYLVRYHDPVRSLGADGAGSADNVARAPMPGVTVAVLVSPGDAVAAGAGLVVIESMKLETTIRAPRAGTVEAVHAVIGAGFERDQVLVTLEKAD